MFQLVKALNRTDKRNFKLLTQLTSGDKKYLRLFDAIDRQSVYDEDRLVNQFQNDPMVKQFSVSKNYLYKNILRSLVFFYQGKNQDLSVTNIQVVILVDKNLHAQALKLLRKAKLRASQIEDYHEVLQLLRTERRILKDQLDFRGLEQQLEELRDEEREAETKRDNQQACLQLLDRMEVVCLVHRHARGETDLDEMETLLADPLLRSADAAQGDRAKAIYYRIMGLALAYLDDLPGALEMGQSRLQVYEGSRKLREAFNEQHVVALREVGDRLLALGRYEDWLVLRKEMSALPVFTEAARLSLGIGVILLEMQAALQLGDREAGEKASQEFRALAKKDGKRIRLVDSMQFYYLAGWLSFVAGENEEALQWMSSFVDLPRTDLRQDLQCYARLTMLFIHFELENVDLLESILKSTVRFIFKRERMYRPERMVIRAIRMLMQREEGGTAQQIFGEMQDELLRKTGDRFDTPAFRALNLDLYLRSKLQNVSMVDLLKSKGG